MIHVLIPARNEANNIGEVLSSFLGKGTIDITVIDDNSLDGTYEICNSQFGVKVLRNDKRIGRDQSLKIGLLSLTNLSNNDWVVFFDADRQHLPEFVFSIDKYSSKRILKGKRFSKLDSKNLKTIPLDRIVISIIFEFLCCEFLNIHVQDVNCGLIAFRASETKWIIDNCKFDFHISMEIFLRSILRNEENFIHEIDIPAIYKIRTVNDIKKYVLTSQHERFYERLASLLNKFIDILGEEVVVNR